MSYRVLICGDRYWTNYKEILRILRAIVFVKKDVTVIDGMAPGADTLGHKAARALGCKWKRFRAEWEKYGKAAGPIRNRKQMKEGRPHVVLAFHNDIKNSKGTKDMISVAKAAGVRVRLFREKKPAMTQIEAFEMFLSKETKGCSLFCSEATFPYLLKALERAGNKKNEVNLSKVKVTKGMVPIYTSHRLPIGMVVAADGHGAIVGRYKVELKD